MSEIITQDGRELSTESLVEDLTAFFTAIDGFSVVTVYNGVSSAGFLDMPGQVIVGGSVLSTDYSLTVQASVFAGIAAGDSVTVAGIGYTVREPLLIDDGKLMQISLMKD